MRQKTKVGSEQLRMRVQILEQQNVELQRRLRRLEASARPLQARLVRAVA